MKPYLLLFAGLTVRALGGPSQMAESPPVRDSMPNPFFNALFSGTQRLDAEVEGLSSDDISVWRPSLTYEQQRGDLSLIHI